MGCVCVCVCERERERERERMDIVLFVMPKLDKTLFNYSTVPDDAFGGYLDIHCKLPNLISFTK